ncbi:Hypothetical predicted protein [Mytilus galloprovincialis]|uniref:Endonuclease/exonuclease/phosphatase domain-containing protein n=1 Tax=Mytilus galloprovincialis TaxID=29158 RepID=A0A8B6DMZ6_MYTGA|nr:Hypothetical predicted protein [Mytilus galloprovincialis]
MVFLNFVNTYEILFLCETWLQEKNIIEIEGFVKLICLNRNVKIGTRSEGGLAIFCKTKLSDGISIDREIDCGIVIIKLNHEFFNTANDIYICFSYIPHEKSNFYNKCDVDFYDIIERVCLEYKEKGSFLVCGDLNSRIGEIDDVLSNDNLDLYLESVDHVETPIVPKRHSVDKTVNAFGRKLLQLCYNTEPYYC